MEIYQQSVGSTGNGVPLSGLTGFAHQFESQGSRICWENLCLSVRAGTSSLDCGTGLKVSPTVGAFPMIPRGQKQKEKSNGNLMASRDTSLLIRFNLLEINNVNN